MNAATSTSSGTSPTPVRRSGPVQDRAAGAVLGSAVGDALGAGYEFATPPAPGKAAMIGGGLGNFAPGEWTDDTSQAVPILRAAASGLDLRSPDALEQIAAGWMSWFNGWPPDVGIHTRQVFASIAVADDSAPLYERMRTAAYARHAQTGRTAGNGALMRTGPVALAHLDDPAACAQAARMVGTLTHPDPVAAEACVIWCEAIRHAIHTGTYDGLRAGIALLPADRAAFWTAKVDEAEADVPGTFGDNGFVVVTLQDAWSAITHTPTALTGGHAFAHSVDAAVGSGNDTDTVAAVAGALAGARWGASTVPHAWKRILHGWPFTGPRGNGGVGLTGADLVALAVRAVHGGSDDATGWPSVPSLCDYYAQRWTVRPGPVPHPDDAGVLVGTSGTLPMLAAGGRLAGHVDAVMSLCRIGASDVPDGVEAISVWLIDSADPAANPHLEWVLDDAVDTLAALRAEGKRVLLHCVAAESRTPTIAALYGARVAGDTPLAALARIQQVMPQAAPKRAFHDLLTSRSTSHGTGAST